MNDATDLDSTDPYAMSFDADGDGYAESTMIDADGDGIADTFIEEDPYTGAMAVATDTDGDGLVDTVAVDYDGDGIIDSEDAMPNDPEDFDGFEDHDGAPDLDNDLDGIADASVVDRELIIEGIGDDAGLLGGMHAR